MITTCGKSRTYRGRPDRGYARSATPTTHHGFALGTCRGWSLGACGRGCRFLAVATLLLGTPLWKWRHRRRATSSAVGKAGGTLRLGAVLPMFSHPFFIAQRSGLAGRGRETRRAKSTCATARTTTRNRSSRSRR